jgi:hypothetical protein
MQVVMIVVAAVIGLVYIQPTISSIGEIQDSTYAYQLEIQKVADVNRALANHVAVVDSVSFDRMRALETYFPDYIDEIAITKDFVVIFDSIGVEPISIKYSGAEITATEVSSEELVIEEGGEFPAAPAEPVNPITPHTFDISAQFTYIQLKQFIDAINVSSYPLHIKEMKVTPSEGGFITADFSIETYSRFPGESLYGDVTQQ